MRKKLLPLLVGFVLLLSGCAEEVAVQETVETEFTAAGLTITLTDAFAEKDHMGFTAIYLSEDLACMTLKEPFTHFENTDYSAESTLAEYASLVWLANELPGTLGLQETDGLTWFTYDIDVSGTTNRYRTYVFKGSDAFWLVQFYTTADRYEGLSETIHAYAKTIVVE